MIARSFTSTDMRLLILMLVVVNTGFPQVLADSSTNDENTSVEITDLGQPPRKEEFRDFEERCNRVGGKGAMAKLENSTMEMIQCFTDSFNITEIEEEVDKAMPEGNLDVIFRKYCGKKDKIKECSDISISAIKVCFRDDEMDLLKTITVVRDEALNFVCYKEGDRIALFIGSEGLECVKDKLHNINTCFKTTFPEHFGRNASSKIPQSFSAVFSEENCRKADEMQNCITKELKKCNEPTPANIIDSLLLAMKKDTPCASSGDICVATLLHVMYCSVLATLILRYFS